MAHNTNKLSSYIGVIEYHMALLVPASHRDLANYWYKDGHVPIFLLTAKMMEYSPGN